MDNTNPTNPNLTLALRNNDSEPPVNATLALRGVEPGSVRVEEVNNPNVEEFNGTIIAWLQDKYPGVLQGQHIKSVKGDLQKESNGSHFAAEIYTRKVKLLDGKTADFECLKSTIVWKVTLTDGKELIMKEPFLSQVDYPSENALKRFSLWANVYIATMKLPLLGRDPAAMAKITDFAKGNISMQVADAMHMSDHTIATVTVGAQREKFLIDLTSEIAQDRLVVRPAVAEQEESQIPTPGMLREKIFQEANLIVVYKAHQVQNEEILNFSAVEDSDNLTQALTKTGITPAAYVEFLRGRVPQLERDFKQFSHFLSPDNTRWGTLNFQQHYLKVMREQTDKQEALKVEISRLTTQATRTQDLQEKIKEQRIVEEEIQRTERLLDNAKANLKQMRTIETSLKKIEAQLNILKQTKPVLQGIEGLKIHTESVAVAFKAGIVSYEDELAAIDSLYFEEASSSESDSDDATSRDPLYNQRLMPDYDSQEFRSFNESDSDDDPIEFH